MRNAKSQRARRGKRRTRRERRGSRAAGLRPRRLFQEPLEARTLLSVTPQLIDLNPSGASWPSDFVGIGDTTFFVADDATSGRELWKTDGTPEGTSLVADIRSGSGSSDPRELVEFNSQLFFVADDGVNGQELWKSDGTAAGTVMVRDINPGEGYQYPYGDGPFQSFPRDLTVAGGVLFFSAEDAANGGELWMSDGTSAGTVLVKDLFSGTYTHDYGTYPNSSNPLNLTNVDGTLFFTAHDEDSGRELWKSDGTAAGTVRVKDIFAGTYAYYDGQYPNASRPDKLTAVDGALFFVATDEAHGTELWKSDGTDAGTVLVRDILTGATDGFTEDDSLTDVNGTLFFTADNGTGGHELWKSDGTEAGTVVVKDIYPGGEWYDGYTDEGDQYLGYAANSSSPQDFTPVNGVLFFSADDGVSGRELWKSDGTESGTVMVKDVYSGSVYDYSSYSYVPNSSSPQELTKVGGKLFFTADDGTYGREVWTSDGTAEGTVLAYNLVAGSGSSSPLWLFDRDGTLLFSADDGVADRELWTFVDAPQAEEFEARLTILIDGQQQAIPANVGVDSGGALLAQVHTVDSDGTLRIEPIGNEPLEDVTLGDFFETWRTNAGQPGNNPDAVFNEEQILGHFAGGDYMIQVFVNGQADRYFDAYAIQDGDAITIVYTSNEVVSLNTNVGSILIELYENQTPITVDNFLNYVNDGDYINSFFHRSVPGFMIQGGGFATSSTYFYGTNQFSPVPTDGPIQNEPGISNLEGTVAMAKLGGDPNSATSQFFVNLGDNSFLDLPGNNSFTVFGRVLDMTTAKAIEALDVNYSNGSPYGELPLTDGNEVVVIQSIGGEGDLSGTSFEDLNFDGVQDAGEDGLAGVTVYADANGDGALNEGEYSTIADSLGDWQLRLPVGNHVIRQVPAGSLYATTVEGTGGHTVTVEMGREIDGLDFANTAGVPPVATADTYSVNEDATLTIDAGEGVLENDTNEEGGPLEAVLVDDALHGNLALAADGSFTYTPDADFYGNDSFTYRAQDANSQSSTVTVTLEVLSQPDAPNAVNDAFTSPEGDQGRALNVLDNDTTDPDGAQSLTILAVTQASLGGTVTTDGSTIEYTPTAAFSGTETFTYTIEDADGLTDVATVTVTVADEALGSISGYVYCDSDDDGRRDAGEKGIYGVRVTLTGVDNQGNSVNTAILTSGDGSYRFDGLAPGTYEITEQQPAALLDGQDTIGTAGGTESDDHFSNIVLGDNEHSTENNVGERGLRPKFVTLAMFLASTPAYEAYFPEMMAKAEEAAGNTELAALIRDGDTDVPDDFGDDLPEANNDSYTVDEDDVRIVDAAQGVLVNDLDVGVFFPVLVTGPSNGSLTNFDADGSFTYTPDADFNGTDTFTYKLTNGTLESDTATVTITVDASGDENNAPIAANDTYSINEDATLAVAPADGVLVNDSDPDGDSPLYAVIYTYALNGSLSLGAEGSFTYIPDPNFHGTDSFTYTVSDGSLDSGPATVTITVVSVNDLPVAEDDRYDVEPDTPLTIGAGLGILDNDSDNDLDTLLALVSVDPANGILDLVIDGSFTYTPNAGFHGEDTFTYYAYDGASYSDIATVTLVVNDPPAAVNDSYETDEDTPLTVETLGVLSNDSDNDGDALTAVPVSGPVTGTVVLNPDGSFTYTPSADFHGTDTFTYKANDGFADSPTATVTIAVNPVNDAPVAVDDSYSVGENDTLNVNESAGVLDNDYDVDGTRDTPLTSLGITEINYAPYDPTGDELDVDDGFAGDDFEFIELQNIGDLTIDLEGVVFVDGVIFDFTGSDVTELAPHETVLVVANTAAFEARYGGDLPVAGEFDGDLNNDGEQITLKDGAGETIQQFTYDDEVPWPTEPDGNGKTLEVLDVTGDYDDPANWIAGDAWGGTPGEDTDVTVAVDYLMAQLMDGPDHAAAFELHENGSFAYTPEQGWTGIDSFTYKAGDGADDSEEATVTIEVTELEV